MQASDRGHDPVRRKIWKVLDALSCCLTGIRHGGHIGSGAGMQSAGRTARSRLLQLFTNRHRVDPVNRPGRMSDPENNPRQQEIALVRKEIRRVQASADIATVEHLEAESLGLIDQLNGWPGS